MNDDGKEDTTAVKEQGIVMELKEVAKEESKKEVKEEAKEEPKKDAK